MDVSGRVWIGVGAGGVVVDGSIWARSGCRRGEVRVDMADAGAGPVCSGIGRGGTSGARALSHLSLPSAPVIICSLQ